MAELSSTPRCPICAAPQRLRSRFCGSCGSTLPAELVAHLPETVDALPAPTPTPLPPPIAPELRVPTLYGVGNGPAPKAVEVAPAPVAAVANAHATLFGMPASSALKAPAPVQTAPAPVQGSSAFVANAEKTMMGVAVAPPSNEAASPSQGESPRVSIVPAAVAPVRSATYPSERPPASAARRAKKKKSRGWVVPVAVLAGAGLCALLAVALLSPPAASSLVASDGRVEADGALHLRVRLGASLAGARVTSGGVSATADNQGDAALLLPLAPERVGTLELPLEVRPTQGGVLQRSARLVVGWRASPELDALGDATPQLRVQFRVPPSATLAVQGQPVTLDAQGLGAFPVPLGDASGEGARTFELPLHIRLADGTATDDRFVLTVPRVVAAVQRPAPATLTSADSVLVQGRGVRLTGVTVNNVVATVQDDTFSAVVPVVGAVTELVLVVRARGALPLRVTRTVQRLAPGDARLAAYRPPVGLSAPHLALATVPDGALGLVHARRVGEAFVQGGATSWQVVAEDHGCPEQRCVFWVETEPGVTLPAERNLTLYVRASGRRSWVTGDNTRRQDTVLYPVLWQEGP